MKKAEIVQLTNTELFVFFNRYVIRLVHEAHSVRGETKKTTREFNWIVDECINRFDLDRDTLIERHVI